jgi:hypothetical protein
MSPTSPAAPGPRLVRPGDDEPSADPPVPQRRIGWLLPLALAAALVAAAGWGLESRRAAALTAQVAGLETRLRAQQAEIAQRQRHLESIRSVTSAVEEQLSALRLLVDRDPATPAPARTPAVPR